MKQPKYEIGQIVCFETSTDPDTGIKSFDYAPIEMIVFSKEGLHYILENQRKRFEEHEINNDIEIIINSIIEAYDEMMKNIKKRKKEEIKEIREAFKKNE